MLSWAVEYVDFANPSHSHSHIGQHDGVLDSVDTTTGIEDDIDLDSDEEEDHSEISDEDDVSDVDNDE